MEVPGKVALTVWDNFLVCQGLALLLFVQIHPQSFLPPWVSHYLQSLYSRENKTNRIVKHLQQNYHD